MTNSKLAHQWSRCKGRCGWCGGCSQCSNKPDCAKGGGSALGTSLVKARRNNNKNDALYRLRGSHHEWDFSRWEKLTQSSRISHSTHVIQYSDNYMAPVPIWCTEIVTDAKHFCETSVQLDFTTNILPNHAHNKSRCKNMGHLHCQFSDAHSAPKAMNAIGWQ